VHTHDSSTLKADTGGSQIGDQPGLQMDTVSKKKKKVIAVYFLNSEYLPKHSNVNNNINLPKFCINVKNKGRKREAMTRAGHSTIKQEE
jgi:hypothetical protein